MTRPQWFVPSKKGVCFNVFKVSKFSSRKTQIQRISYLHIKQILVSQEQTISSSALNVIFNHFEYLI